MSDAELNKLLENKPEHFDDLAIDKQDILVNWCKNFDKIKSFNTSRTSYGLKHVFRKSSNGFYVTNGQFKGAMLKAGFDVRNKNDLNWVFNISKKSPNLK